jgi:hypothetical protein
MKNLKMVRYNHPDNLNVWYFQYQKDPLPLWAIVFSEPYSDEQLQKFAELIVRECIGVVEGGSFLHDQAPAAIFARECSSAIKRHFGIEEGE